MQRWLKQYGAVSRNCLVVALGSPFALIMLVAILVVEVILTCLPFFTFGDQLRLIRDQSLALCLIGGCLTCALGACQLVVDDIRRGAVPVMMSRPLSPICLVLGKWTGLTGAVLLILFNASIACLWLTRIGAHSEFLNVPALAQYILAVLVPVLVVGVRHYLVGGCYPLQACTAISICFPLVFFAHVLLAAGGIGGAGVDWGTGAACLMTAFAMVSYSGIMVLLGVAADSGLVMGLGILVFFCGVLSEYVIRVVAGGGWLASVLRALVPNWQLFWMADALAAGKKIPTAYVVLGGFYVMLVIGFLGLVAVVLFWNREVGGQMRV